MILKYEYKVQTASEIKWSLNNISALTKKWKIKLNEPKSMHINFIYRRVFKKDILNDLKHEEFKKFRKIK